MEGLCLYYCMIMLRHSGSAALAVSPNSLDKASVLTGIHCTAKSNPGFNHSVNTNTAYGRPENEASVIGFFINILSFSPTCHSRWN